ASLGLFTVAPASVPVLFRSAGRISRAAARFGLPYLSAKKRNRHGGRRYGQEPGTCVIRYQGIALALTSGLAGCGKSLRSLLPLSYLPLVRVRGRRLRKEAIPSAALRTKLLRRMLLPSGIIPALGTLFPHPAKRPLWRWFKPVATVVSTYTNKKRIEE